MDVAMSGEAFRWTEGKQCSTVDREGRHLERERHVRARVW